jgi:hypothetical protein
MTEQAKRAGWTTYGDSARKFHYTEDADGDGRSLCGKWARNPFARVALPVTPDNAAGEDGKPGKDDCVVCWRRLRGVKA